MIKYFKLGLLRIYHRYLEFRSFIICHVMCGYTF